MITDLIYLLILLLLLIIGISKPVFALVAVIWVDILKPQDTSFSFLAGTPLSMIVTACFFLSLAINFKQIKAPTNFKYHLFLIGFMVWITITTLNAQYPILAWLKFDVVFKTVLAAYFIPFVLKKRSDIELFVVVAASAFGFFIFVAGVKSLLGGGGYGISLVGSSTFMYGEGSTLATLAVCMIPMFWYVSSTSLFAKNSLLFKWIFNGYVFCSLLTLVGTQARTGIIALIVLLLLMIKSTKKKIRVTFLAAMFPLVILFFAPDAWFNRMESISSGEATTSEASAVGRLVVWKWTLHYVSTEHPITGGGFYAYLDNANQLHLYSNEEQRIIDNPHGKAFHSIIFQVLGEQGFVGLFLFLGIVSHIYLINRKLRFSKERWKMTMSDSLNKSLIIYCTGGLFVGIAYYPWMYYLYGLTISLSNLNSKREIDNQ
ncbi:putative O-glycosylation ligase, exosortase A system-associated [Paraglaciecola sp.]|uniref:putative O-glycosylation ligase, exosortase A system-associated n=1 Tax=Paraglaciecola sp. TaxID=1920173 RepID=UPI002740212F|nr:putative O-glycosylation ligase, exosortase A system-associated [Paraglaciecola sp.]MDP5030990.1 putative O-glycosylation ligase, exosortase A system-associated [Paraglaciecola sp.]